MGDRKKRRQKEREMHALHNRMVEGIQRATPSIHLAMHESTDHPGPITYDDIIKTNLPASERTKDPMQDPDIQKALQSFIDQFSPKAPDPKDRHDEKFTLSEEQFTQYALAFKAKYGQSFENHCKMSREENHAFTVADALEEYIKGRTVSWDEMSRQPGHNASVTIKTSVPKR